MWKIRCISYVSPSYRRRLSALKRERERADCSFVPDWVLDGVADLCAEAGGRFMDWRENGHWENRENEWYVNLIFHSNLGSLADSV